MAERSYVFTEAELLDFIGGFWTKTSWDATAREAMRRVLASEAEAGRLRTFVEREGAMDELRKWHEAVALSIAQIESIIAASENTLRMLREAEELIAKQIETLARPPEPPTAEKS